MLSQVDWAPSANSLPVAASDVTAVPRPSFMAAVRRCLMSDVRRSVFDVRCPVSRRSTFDARCLSVRFASAKIDPERSPSKFTFALIRIQRRDQAEHRPALRQRAEAKRHEFVVSSSATKRANTNQRTPGRPSSRRHSRLAASVAKAQAGPRCLEMRPRSLRRSTRRDQLDDLSREQARVATSASLPLQRGKRR